MGEGRGIYSVAMFHKNPCNRNGYRDFLISFKTRL